MKVSQVCHCLGTRSQRIGKKCPPGSLAHIPYHPATRGSGPSLSWAPSRPHTWRGLQGLGVAARAPSLGRLPGVARRRAGLAFPCPRAHTQLILGACCLDNMRWERWRLRGPAHIWLGFALYEPSRFLRLFLDFRETALPLLARGPSDRRRSRCREGSDPRPAPAPLAAPSSRRTSPPHPPPALPRPGWEEAPPGDALSPGREAPQDAVEVGGGRGGQDWRALAPAPRLQPSGRGRVAVVTRDRKTGSCGRRAGSPEVRWGAAASLRLPLGRGGGQGQPGAVRNRNDGASSLRGGLFTLLHTSLRVREQGMVPSPLCTKWGPPPQ